MKYYKFIIIKIYFCIFFMIKFKIVIVFINFNFIFNYEFFENLKKLFFSFDIKNIGVVLK